MKKQTDLVTARRTIKWLYQQRQLHQFRLRAVTKRRNELKEERNRLKGLADESRTQIDLFGARIDRELDRHGDTLGLRPFDEQE